MSETPVQLPLRRVARRWLRSAGAALAAFLLVTCSSDSPVGPGRRGIGSLRVAPSFDAFARVAPLSLDGVRVIVVRPAAETLAVVPRPFDPNSNQLQLNIPVFLQSVTEDLLVTLELYSGQILLFSGTRTVRVSQGAATPPDSIPVAYQGPGSQVTTLAISPRDTTVNFGAILPYVVNATDAQQAPVAQYYVSWSTPGAPAGTTIDATGRLTAPSQRDTFYVKAVTPNGVIDSTSVIIAAAPAALAKASGDGQSALAGTRLALPLAVQVNGTDGLPVPGIVVSFAAGIGGGSVDSATATTDAQGIARSGATLGATVGPQSFTASAAGLAAVTFSATGISTSGTVTWTGATSSTWTVAGNWNPALVPDSTSDVVIPSGAPNQPSVTAAATCFAKTLTVNAGATLGMGAFDCQVKGNVFADGGITGSGSLLITAAAQLRGNVANLVVSAPVTVAGNTLAAGNVTSLSGGDLIIGGHTVQISGSLVTQLTGLFTMTNPLDSVVVLSAATFAGGDETGHLTAGYLKLAGSLGQTGGSSGASFAASGTHRTEMGAGAIRVINFATPGAGAGTSHFNDLIINGASGGIGISNNTFVNGQLISHPTGATPVIGVTAAGPKVLTAAGVDVSALGIDQNVMTIGAGTITRFDNVAFTSQASGVTQLTINNAGSAAPLSFNGLSFGVTPTTGLYLAANDLDGATPNALTIDMVGATPSAPSLSLFSATNGAVVNWPSLSPSTVTWTGAVDTDWNKSGNWSPAQVPTGLDSVVIPNGLATNPTLTGRAVVASVFQDGRLTLNGGVLQVTRDLIGAAVLNRVTALTLPTDSLIVGDSLNGNVIGGGSVIGGGGVLVVGGSIGQGLGPVFLTVVLNGTGAQSWVQGTSQQGGILLVRKPSGSVSFPSGVRMDSIDVNTAIPLSGTALVSERGLSTAGSLTFSSLSVAGPLTVGGAYAVGTTTFVPATGVTALTVPALTYQSLVVDGSSGSVPTLSLVGRTVVTGSLQVGGTSRGILDLNGHTLAVSGSLLTNGLGGSYIRMVNALDSLIVAGNADFSAAVPVSQNYMTAGTFLLGGTFNQGSPFGGVPFQATGSHLTVLTAANPVVTFATPGTASNQNHFQHLTWTGSGTLTAGSGIALSGTLTTTATSAVTFIGNIGTSRFLQFADIAAAGPLVFDSVRVIVVQPGAGTPIGLGNATFQHLPNSITQLTIQHPGLSAGSVTLPNLTFTSPPVTGGLYLSASDNNTSDGIPLVVDLSNPTPATDGGFSSGTNATINWPASSPAASWTGSTSTDWFVGTNWSTGQVPGTTTDVTIPSGTPNAPVLTNTSTIQSLTVAAGATLDVGNNLFVVSGDIDAQGTILVNPVSGAVRTTGTARALRGNIGLIDVVGTYSLNGNLSVASDIIVHGTLTIAGHTASIGNNLSLFSAGVLVMQNPADTVLVTNQATFAGGATAGLLTEGLLEVRGKLLQTNSGTGFPANSFSASGNHTTRLAGPNPQQVDIFNVGSGPTASHFANLDLSLKTGSVDFTRLNTLVVEGMLISKPSATPPILGTSNGATLSVGGVDVSGLSFNALPLIIGSGPIVQFDNVTLDAPVGATQLTVNHPGQATPFQFINLSFPTTPTTGRYLLANDTDGPTPNALVISMVNPTPATDGGFTSATNGAVINWPAPLIWTGATSTDWSTASNWSTGTIPITTSDVTIPAGTPNQPTLNTSVQLHNLTIQTGATLTTNDIGVLLTGNLDASGLLVGCCGDVITLNGGTLRGNFDNVLLVISAGTVTTLNGATTLVNSNVQDYGELILAGNTLDVGQGYLNTLAGTGLLTMTNAADLVKAGSLDFSGANATGHLTAGAIHAQTLTQGGAGGQDPASFFASGNHKVVLGGPAASTISFANPANSRFQELDVTSVASSLTLISDVTVAGQLISVPSAVSGPVVSGAGVTLTAGGADIGAPQGVTALTMDGVPMVLSGGAITNLSGVTFSNQSPSGIALTVNNAGTAAPFTFANLSFTTILTTGGLHIQANDLDGASPNPLVIDVIGASPASGAGVSQANNGAIINWPPVGSLNWTGAISGDWSIAGNWDLGRVPTAVDDATIGIGTPNLPKLSVNSAINNLTIQAGVTVDLDTTVLVIGGNLVNGGSITGLQGTAGVTLVGTGKTMEGTIGVDVVIPGSYTLSGNTGALSLSVAGATGSLTLNGHQASTSAGFSTLNSGTVTMNNSADLLLVGGLALFAGGDESGKLTAGALQLAGDFTQIAATSQTSFAPSGTHKTVLSSAAPQTIDFGSPGAGSGGSHFQVLDLTGAVGGATLTVNSIVDSVLVSGNTAAKLIGGGSSLTSRIWNVTGLTVDNAPMILNENGLQSTQVFDNVAFQGFPTTANSSVLIDVTAQGNATGGRFIDIHSTQLQTSLGTGGLYLRAQSGNGIGYTLRMIGSNDPTGGFSRSQAIAPVTIQYQ